METFREQGVNAYKKPEVAEAYDARPGYPPEAIDYLLEQTLLPPQKYPAPRILDAGAGNGLVTEGILKSGRKVEIVAMDQSEAMMTAFRRRIDERKGPPVIGDFNAIPFAENSFDLIVFGTALHWGNSESLPAELHRVLRQGGSVATISNSIPLSGSNIFSHFSPDRILFQENPITLKKEEINLGKYFSSQPELFKEFSYETTMAEERFYQFLQSIDLFHLEEDAAKKAWAAAKEYFSTNEENGQITIPVDTLIRIARVRR